MNIYRIWNTYIFFKKEEIKIKHIFTHEMTTWQAPRPILVFHMSCFIFYLCGNRRRQHTATALWPTVAFTVIFGFTVQVWKVSVCFSPLTITCNINEEVAEWLCEVYRLEIKMNLCQSLIQCRNGSCTHLYVKVFGGESKQEPDMWSLVIREGAPTVTRISADRQSREGMLDKQEMKG